jgi:hypothetical protein
MRRKGRRSVRAKLAGNWLKLTFDALGQQALTGAALLDGCSEELSRTTDWLVEFDLFQFYRARIARR